MMIILFLCASLAVVGGVELTFELQDNARECFFEVLMNDTKCTLEFQVVTGGHYDVDVTLRDPHGEVLYDEKKKQYDSHNFDTKISGEYMFCFSNEFSTFTHKVVYFDFQVGTEPPLLPSLGSHQTVLTQLESSSVSIHESLKSVADYQTHHRLREATGRDNAEYLHDRVQFWSLGQSILVVIVSIGQVFILRNFFAEKRDRI